MRFANVISHAGEEPVVAVVQEDGRYLNVRGAVAAAGALKGQTYPSVSGSLLAVACDAGLRRVLTESTESLTRAGRLAEFILPADLPLAAPISSPVRILAIGRNYAEHAREQGAEVFGEPIVFLKASTSVIGPDQAIEIPRWVGRVDYEAELMVVLGKGGKDVPEDAAMELIAGYTVFNDVTARAQQKQDIEDKHPWFRSKSMDTFGPMGPYLVTADEVGDPHDLAIELRVNGEVKQSDRTSSMVFRLPALIAFLSKWFRLLPGDVIATGTPSGIGPLAPGDTVEAMVEKVGTLRNPVIGV